MSRSWIVGLLVAVCSACSTFVGEPVCGVVDTVFTRPFVLRDGSNVPLGLTVVEFKDGRALQLKGKPPERPILKDSIYTFYVGEVGEIALDEDTLKVLNGLYFDQKLMHWPSRCRRPSKRNARK